MRSVAKLGISQASDDLWIACFLRGPDHQEFQMWSSVLYGLIVSLVVSGGNLKFLDELAEDKCGSCREWGNGKLYFCTLKTI